MKKGALLMGFLTTIIGGYAFTADDQPVGAVPPEDAIVEEWTVVYDDYRAYVKNIKNIAPFKDIERPAYVAITNDGRLYFKGLVKECPDVWINALIINDQINMQLTNILHTSAGEAITYFTPIFWRDCFNVTNTSVSQDMQFRTTKDATIDNAGDLIFRYAEDEAMWKFDETEYEISDTNIISFFGSQYKINGYGYVYDSFMSDGETISPYSEKYSDFPYLISERTDSITELPFYMKPRLIPCQNSMVASMVDVKSEMRDENYSADNDKIYDVAGNLRREKNLAPGIYIRNRRKILVK